MINDFSRSRVIYGIWFNVCQSSRNDRIDISTEIDKNHLFTETVTVGDSIWIFRYFFFRSFVRFYVIWINP